MLLLTPLEYCMLVLERDKNNLQPQFYFFDLYDHLADRLSRLDEEQKTVLKDFYPIEEITLSRSTEDRQKIDVWILGRSFEKIVSSLKNKRNINAKEKLESLTVVTTLMKDSINSRIGIEDVLHNLVVFSQYD